MASMIKFLRRFSNGTPWKSFMEILRGPTGSDPAEEAKSGESTGSASHLQCVQEYSLRFSREALGQALLRALEETYNIDWRVYDYISPQCFIYLVQRMLILAPHPSGTFFTSKSSFVEYLVCMPPDANPETSLTTHNKSRPDTMTDFVCLVVDQFLCNITETEVWIKNSGIYCKYYLPVFLLRLVMILCVLCITWGLSFDILNQKMSRSDITRHLPKVFYDALRPRRRGYIQFVSAVATAFKLIGDPLVIVVSGGDITRSFSYPDTVLLDLSSFSCRADIMKKLFPRSTAASDQPTMVEGNVTEPSGIVTPPVVSNEDKKTVVKMGSATASSSGNGYGNLLINWDLIGEIPKALGTCTIRNDESAVVDSKEKGDDKNCDGDAEDEDSKTEDSAVVEVESDPSNKGKGKKKQTKKGNSAAEEVMPNHSNKGKGKGKNKGKSKKGKGGKKN